MHLIDQLGGHGYRVRPAWDTDANHQARLITIAEQTWHGGPTAAVRVLIVALAHRLVSVPDGRLAMTGRGVG
ncbi:MULTISPECIES: hypothetical protein [Actinosynnema]|uniref:hypothetical protein n=1 Tax=Actinosynnema TaxID=40566 RepID=UPI0020A2A38E|nr:hypothetical protein [Actinosynnema pretiosum]MCP2097471.1 hypothetical protein [Actinosynnema pretiosum]